MPASIYVRAKIKKGKNKGNFNHYKLDKKGKKQLISKKAFEAGKKRALKRTGSVGIITKNGKNRAKSSKNGGRKMAKNPMFSNSNANRTFGAFAGATMGRFLGNATPYVALASAFLPKMPTALKVAGTVWATRELADNFMNGGNNNG